MADKNIKKPNDLNEKIKELQAEKDKVEASLNTHLLDIFKQQNIYKHDFDVLLGALLTQLESLNQLTKNSSEYLNFQKKGHSFRTGKAIKDNAAPAQKKKAA